MKGRPESKLDCSNPSAEMCDSVMFEEDVRIWRTTECSSDVQSSQNYINYLSTGSLRALVRFKTDKYVAIGLPSRQSKGRNVQYHLHREPLRCVSHQRDLGVNVDETLKDHRQCAKATKSTDSIMRAIKTSL